VWPGSHLLAGLREWQQAGVWLRLHELLLARLNEADLIDWSRAAIESSHVRASGGCAKTGPSAVDRSRSDSKHHCETRRCW
jgi:hypothetical protein